MHRRMGRAETHDNVPFRSVIKVYFNTPKIGWLTLVLKLDFLLYSLPNAACVIADSEVELCPDSAW